MPPVTSPIDRPALLDRYRRIRARTEALFDLLADEAYYSQPISLRHPIVFYEGHLPAFSLNTLVKKGLGRRGIDAQLESLFARGIDPAETTDRARTVWPSRAAVQEFAAEADRRIVEALANAEIEQPGHPLLDRAEAVFTILEHEAMHQETLLYMWHRLPFEQKRRPVTYSPRVEAALPPTEWINVPGGRATLGVAREAIEFGWDNEFGPAAEDVPAFAIERHDVTNARFLEFVEAGSYRDPRWWPPSDFAWIERERIVCPLFWERHGDRWYWRGMFDPIPLPLAWPVYVSQAEASAFASWSGARLPTEAEFQRAAYGAPAGDDRRRYPWGSDKPTRARGVFDFSSWDPEPAGTHPAGASAWGIEDLVGNGWEWTSTAFAPFPGFVAMASYPEYSADFFDGEHVVMKGASPATDAALLRPTFRNWFRARYPYVYATFRCVRGSGAAR